VVIQVHWGDEYKEEPTERQVTLAHLMADLGADAVVGHHPHILQKVERYKGTLIAYSLGNFLFDLRKSSSFPSMVLRLTLDTGQPAAAEYVPIWLGAMFPRPAKSFELEGFPAWLVPRLTPSPVPTPAP
jgi:poly-gamma-glutamate synthesis protein (capsule biosynthesis protein)